MKQVTPVSKSPNLTTPTLIASWGDISRYITALVQSLIVELQSHATAINGGIISEFNKANLPNAADYKGRWIIVTDDVGGYTAAISDGVNFRRMQDRAIIS